MASLLKSCHLGLASGSSGRGHNRLAEDLLIGHRHLLAHRRVLMFEIDYQMPLLDLLFLGRHRPSDTRSGNLPPQQAQAHKFSLPPALVLLKSQTWV